MKLNLNVRIFALTLALLLGAFPVMADERPFVFYGNGEATFMTDWAGNIIGADFTVAGRKIGVGMDATAAGGKIGGGTDITTAGGKVGGGMDSAAWGEAFQPGVWRAVGALQFTPAPNDGRGRNLGNVILTLQGRVRMGEEIPTLQFIPTSNPPNPLQTCGATTLTAANGDKLQAFIDGVMDVPTGHVRGSLQFVGGTGQFTQASGTAHFVLEQNRTTGAFEVTVVGSINF
ncbi:MAG TPA: hypothetical protein VFZ34_25960 [Blastocatellia bacterium]|nr:hypothetical protein [Blastocatellia bacterium]